MSFFRKTRFFIILIGIIVLVALIGYSLNDRDKLSLPEQFINDTVGWAQRIVHTPVKYVSNFFSNIGDIKNTRSEEHTSELQSRFDLVCRLLLEKKKSYTR